MSLALCVWSKGWMLLHLAQYLDMGMVRSDHEALDASLGITSVRLGFIHADKAAVILTATCLTPLVPDIRV